MPGQSLHQLFTLLSKDPKVHFAFKTNPQVASGIIASPDSEPIFEEDEILSELYMGLKENYGIKERIHPESDKMSRLFCENGLNTLSLIKEHPTLDDLMHPIIDAIAKEIIKENPIIFPDLTLEQRTHINHYIVENMGEEIINLKYPFIKKMTFDSLVNYKVSTTIAKGFTDYFTSITPLNKKDKRIVYRSFALMLKHIGFVHRLMFSDPELTEMFQYDYIANQGEGYSDSNKRINSLINVLKKMPLAIGYRVTTPFYKIGEKRIINGYKNRGRESRIAKIKEIAKEKLISYAKRNASLKPKDPNDKKLIEIFKIISGDYPLPQLCPIPNYNPALKG